MSNEGKFYASDSPERFYTDPHDTKEAAIEEFKSENEGRDPTVIGIGREVFCDVDGCSLVENLANGHLYEELYEDALDGWCNFRPTDPRWDSLSERLTKVLHDWLDEVGEPKSWTVIEQVNA